MIFTYNLKQVANLGFTGNRNRPKLMREGKLVELPAGGAGSLVTYNELYGSATTSAHARPQGEVLGDARPRGRRFPRP